MACYHFTIKADKKPDGTKVAASTHVDYIAREGKYKDYDKTVQIENVIPDNRIFSDIPIEEAPDRTCLLYRSPFGNIYYSKNGVHVSDNTSVETVAIALGVTEKIYGGKVSLSGTALFQAQVLVAANEMNLPLHFADTHLEEKYKQMQEVKIDGRREFERNGGKIRKSKTVFKPHLKQRTFKDVTQKGFSLPNLSERPMVSTRKGTDMLLSDHDDANLLRQRTKLPSDVRWDVSGGRRKNVNTVRNAIMKNLQNHLDSVKAASHVQYINREAAFKQRGGCVYQNNHLPKWANGSAKKFFSAADRYEGTGNVRYKEIEFMLPNELSLDSHKEIIEQFLDNHLKDFYYHYAVHNKIGVMSNGEHHPHVHIMFSERKIDDAELEKERPASRFFAYPTRNPKSLSDKRKGGALKDRKWEDKNRSKYLFYMREDFAKIQNSILEKYNVPSQVDHRSLEVQRNEALTNGNLRLAQLLDRMPEEYIGPENALKNNSNKVTNLKKYRAYKEEHRKLLYAAEIMENSIDEDISNSTVNSTTEKIKELAHHEIYKSDSHRNMDILHSLKENMIKSLREVNTLNRTVIWNKDAIDMAKLKFMTLEERELWQELKTLQEQRSHWKSFQNSFKKPSEHRQEAIAAYTELAPELSNQIEDLNLKIQILALKVKPISERLSAPLIQKKIQQETAKILWEDKSTKARLKEATENLKIATNALETEIKAQMKNTSSDERIYSIEQVAELLVKTQDELTSDYEKNISSLQKLETRVISYERAIAMAKDVYVKGDFKKLRENFRKLKKKEKSLSNDKAQYTKVALEFSKLEKPSFFHSKEVKLTYENKKDELQQLATKLSLQEKSIAIEKTTLAQEQKRLNNLCVTSIGKGKIEEIAMGILRKNQPIKEKYESVLKKTDELSTSLQHTKKQIKGVKDYSHFSKNNTKYKVISPNEQSSGGSVKAPDAATIANAILGDSKATQLVARSKGNDEMEKNWSMMTEIEKDEKINSIENLDRY